MRRVAEVRRTTLVTDVPLTGVAGHEVDMGEYSNTDRMLDGRLRALGEARIDSDVDGAAQALVVAMEDERIRIEVESALRAKRRVTRRPAVSLAVLIAVLSATVAAPAVGVGMWLSARTGETGDPATSTEEDASEWLNLSGDDLPGILREAYPAGLQLPPSVTPEDGIARIDQLYAKLNSSGNARAQEGMIATDYEFWAVCAWTNEWLVADSEGDEERMTRASEWLGDTQNIPSIVAHDGGGVVDAMMRFAAGAAAGDREVVEEGYATGACEQLLETSAQ